HVQAEVVVPRVRRGKFKAGLRKNSQIVHARFGGEQCVSRQHLRGVHSQSAVAEGFRQPQSGHERDASEARLVFKIPILQRGFEIPFEKINARDRKSTRLNSSHVAISYAVFCLKKKSTTTRSTPSLT